MFTFNFTFHVPNPFSMSAFSSVANAATDAFTSVATDIREDPELLNYMVAGFGPGGVANGFSGYDSNRLVKSPPSSFQASSSSTSPRSRGFKGSQNRHTVGLGLMNPHARNRNRYSPGHDRNHAEPQGLSSGFININPPPGSGTPRFPTQAYSHSNSYSNFDVYGLSQGVRNHLDNSFPTSRKRGWVPALSEPGCTSANEDFMTGFFDAPMHRNANDVGDRASQPAFSHDGRGVGDRRKWDDEVEDENENAMEAELPPAKRRKGLAGSIVSTALSAALIGTAVGLTVYRLWRDRGRVDSAPPPPYEESQRSHQQTHDPKTSPARLNPEPIQVNGKSRGKRHSATAGRRVAGNSVRHRKPIPQRFHPAAYSQQPEPSQPVQVQDIPSGPFDFKFGQAEEEVEDEAEDQMDWIGDRLSQLIEEGKKALGTEVVVMSDSKEDEVDDGSGLWEDSDGGEFGSPTSRYGRRSLSSPRRKRARSNLPYQIIPGGLGGSSPSRPPAYTSPTKSTSPGSPSLTRSSVEPLSVSGWTRESEGDWQSEEMKASMERARAAYMAKRTGQPVD